MYQGQDKTAKKIIFFLVQLPFNHRDFLELESFIMHAHKKKEFFNRSNNLHKIYKSISKVFGSLFFFKF